MNKQSLHSIAADFAVGHDLTCIIQDLDELFYLAMTSECLNEFETIDRISFVKSYRHLKELIISIKRQTEHLPGS
jgi:hypothetical protein